MSDYKELDVWGKSMDLVEEIYKITNGFPTVEKFGLISQLRRATISIPSNIAEGSQRKSEKEFVNFIHIAKGSLAELETQIILCNRLGFINSIQNAFWLEKVFKN